MINNFLAGMKSWNWKVVIGFLFVIGLTALDHYNKLGALADPPYGYELPTWFWNIVVPILAGFGIVVNPYKKGTSLTASGTPIPPAKQP